VIKFFTEVRWTVYDRKSNWPIEHYSLAKLIRDGVILAPTLPTFFIFIQPELDDSIPEKRWTVPEYIMMAPRWKWIIAILTWVIWIAFLFVLAWETGAGSSL